MIIVVRFGLDLRECVLVAQNSDCTMVTSGSWGQGTMHLCDWTVRRFWNDTRKSIVLGGSVLVSYNSVPASAVGDDW